MTALSPHQDLKKLTYSECPFSPKIEKVVHKNYENCFYTGCADMGREGQALYG